MSKSSAFQAFAGFLYRNQVTAAYFAVVLALWAVGILTFLKAGAYGDWFSGWALVATIIICIVGAFRFFNDGTREVSIVVYGPTSLLLFLSLFFFIPYPDSIWVRDGEETALSTGGTQFIVPFSTIHWVEREYLLRGLGDFPTRVEGGASAAGLTRVSGRIAASGFELDVGNPRLEPFLLELDRATGDPTEAIRMRLWALVHAAVAAEFEMYSLGDLDRMTAGHALVLRAGIARRIIEAGLPKLGLRWRDGNITVTDLKPAINS